MYKLNHRKTGQTITVTDQQYQNYEVYKKSYTVVEKTSDPKPVQIKVEPVKKLTKKKVVKEETKKETK